MYDNHQFLDENEGFIFSEMLAAQIKARHAIEAYYA